MRFQKFIWKVLAEDRLHFCDLLDKLHPSVKLTETAAEKLSEAQVNEVLRIQRSFENTNLAVIDWDAALVVDLTGYVDDVLYALELANLQLEEFRVMDQRLDKYLDRAYEDLDHRGWVFFGRANKTLRHLRRFRVYVAMLTDEVTH